MSYQVSDQYLELTKTSYRDKVFEILPSDPIVETLYFQHAGQPLWKVQQALEHVSGFYWKLLDSVARQFSAEEWRTAEGLPASTDPDRLKEECLDELQRFHDGGSNYQAYSDEFVKVLRLIPRVVALSDTECFAIAEICRLIHNMDSEDGFRMLSRVLPGLHDRQLG